MACKKYVANLLSIAAANSLAKEATQQVDTTMGYRGLQDATRKRRPIYQTPGGGRLGISLFHLNVRVSSIWYQRRSGIRKNR